MTNKYYLSLAIPLIISTITVPLLGAVDTAVVGQIPNPAYIGGVAVGTVIFNTMYWLFGFLRVSTSGFAAQANGAEDDLKSAMALFRPMIIALLVGLLFILFQDAVLYFAQVFLGVKGEVKAVSAEYFSIRIWGAPFTLMNYVVLGWLLGMSHIKKTVFIQIMMNIINIILAYLFVIFWGFGVKGVAVATLIAEMTAFLAGIYFLSKNDKLRIDFHLTILGKELLDKAPLKKMMIVNRDLFIRTICLLLVFNIFTAKGAAYGTEILAANAILIQIHYIMAYFYDGLANASSILTGKAVGQGNRQLYENTVKKSYQWSILFSIAISLLFFLFKENIIPLFTIVKDVITISKEYEYWLVLFPICSCFGLVFYGIFTGATEAGLVRNSMIGSILIFFLVLFPSTHYWGNHGLWFSFIVFSLCRSLLLWRYMPKLREKLVFKKAE
ncbi:MATE family efflux transporter [Niallia nealsonii]|uniref:Probable multidrug resistance protein NorM n=1 Tax=Niallia nealsonii TaxID=115979 RepID=A0A2N0YZV4_9BACI|nr:MATE family efflux transporter [Niallia nealsonii]PKG22788.1 MATE family efflux transporter [Niallia nealsonii]